MDTAADGANRHLEDVADLGVWQPHDIAQDDRGAEFVGQRVQRSLDVGSERPAGKLVVGAYDGRQDLVSQIRQWLDRAATPAT
jgi:hypothetical protein